MFQFTKNDFIRFSCIGKQVTVNTKTGKWTEGTLIQISMDHIVVLDRRTGLEYPISFGDFEVCTFEGRSKGQTVDRIGLAGFLRECDRLAGRAKLTLVGQYSDKLEQCIKSCEIGQLKDYLKAEYVNQAGSYFPEELENLLSQLQKYRKADTDMEIDSVLEAMLYYRMRKYGDALAAVMDAAEEISLQDLSLRMACILFQMKTYVGALLWLNHYYANSLDNLSSGDQIWWLYLKLCSRYSSFQAVSQAITRLAQKEPVLAIQSLAYLFLAQNNAPIAVLLLDYAGGALNVHEALDLIERNKSFLIPDPDNNYHRYEKCVNQILALRQVKVYDDMEDIQGFVYDYIPDKEFGFIVGFDLISYYFQKDSIESDNVRRQIKDNICSFSSVEEEDYVMVTFQRTLESKRSYNAIRIV